ncbi:FEKKY domain-containing protein [Flammeovirga agarivorans]|uniref:Carboxypeptidase-like regulatory domain-containing protein n=1 Tax=Flammeovirga agarivorans TaxID=2726742 RepID=A0A7X8SRM2_9BACT|nr:carboxypeptidase-like regulatory domain-containing protein [Flammeovirga agarivorans]NLR95141.1 carboxypeptidase-like regulatory domain-containing protein [Flammeovirga agarivorans]
MKKIITIVLLINLLLVSFSSLTFGQSVIQGYVKSSLTDLRPITDVYVEIVNIDNPILEIATMADRNGFYKLTDLKLGKTYILKVSAFGYANQQFEIKTDSDITKSDLTIEVSCEYSKEHADTDWKNNKAKLLLVGSIAPLANTRADKKFEKKYGVKYYDFGCVPTDFECIKIYNERIFELMDSEFGYKWRDKVRKDVEYLK